MQNNTKQSNKKILFSLFILTLIFLLSCNNYESSEISMYYTDSIPKLKVFYKYIGNKKIIAKEIRYYPNHQILSEGKFNENYKKTGKWTYYFENRKKQRIENYENGVKNGKYIEYYKSGKKTFRGFYYKGLPDGNWTIWNEKGIKISTTKYDNGKILE